MHGPKRNSSELVPMLPEQREQIGVSFRQFFLDGVRQAMRIGIVFFLRFRVEGRQGHDFRFERIIWQHSDVQFRNHQFGAQAGEREEVVFNFLH